MKKLIKKIALLLVPVLLFVVVLLFLNEAYKKTNYWKHIENNAYRFKEVPKEIKLCNVGSSHGMMSFKWEDYPELNAFNFGVSSQPYWLDLVMLKHFEQNIEKGATVIIPLSFFQVYGYKRDGGEHKQNYYFFLNKKEYPVWKLHEYLEYQLLPLFFKRAKLEYLFNDIPKEEISRFAYWKNSPSEKEIIEIADEKVKQAFLTNFNYKNYKENYKSNMSDVCAIVDYCYQQEYVPIFVTTPLYTDYNELLENDIPFFKRSFDTFLKELREKYPSIPYFDYSHDKDFSPNIELFYDDDHLNRFGAEAFTRRLITDLRQAGYLQ